LKVSASTEGKTLYLYPIGELDHHGAKSIMSRIEEKIDAFLPRDCIFDMSGLSFMDSSGIAVILKSYKRVNSLGGRLFVENVPKQPMKVLDTSGIDRIIKISTLA